MYHKRFWAVDLPQSVELEVLSRLDSMLDGVEEAYSFDELLEFVYEQLNALASARAWLEGEEVETSFLPQKRRECRCDFCRSRRRVPGNRQPAARARAARRR